MRNSFKVIPYFLREEIFGRRNFGNISEFFTFFAKVSSFENSIFNVRNRHCHKFTENFLFTKAFFLSFVVPVYKTIYI